MIILYLQNRAVMHVIFEKSWSVEVYSNSHAYLQSKGKEILQTQTSKYFHLQSVNTVRSNHFISVRQKHAICQKRKQACLKRINA